MVLVACFVVSLLVVEWRGSGEASVGDDVAADWVACQAIETRQILAEARAFEVSLTRVMVDRIQDECGSTGDYWALCVHGEISKANKKQVSLGSTRVKQIADSCLGEAPADSSLATRR